MKLLIRITAHTPEEPSYSIGQKKTHEAGFDSYLTGLLVLAFNLFLVLDSNWLCILLFVLNRSLLHWDGFLFR